jgi:predicted MFS family arabinose efflux permease
MQWGMRAVSLGWGVTALFAMGLAWAAQAGWLATLPFPSHVAAYPLFLLRGLFNPVGGIAGQNLLLEIAPKDDRTLYVGFANTLMGVVLLLSSLAGGLMDLLGIQTLFAFSVVMNLLAFLLFGKVRGRRRDAIT